MCGAYAIGSPSVYLTPQQGPPVVPPCPVVPVGTLAAAEASLPCSQSQGQGQSQGEGEGEGEGEGQGQRILPCRPQALGQRAWQPACCCAACYLAILFLLSLLVCLLQ